MTTPDPAARSSDLHAIAEAVWRELAQAVHERTHAWRTPVLATCGPEGPDARTVVLREVDRPSSRLVVYSDARAVKVQQLRHDPRAMLVMWSPTLGWQLRISLTVQVHAEGLAAASRWTRLQLSRAALDYLAPLAPGTPLPATPQAPPPPPEAPHEAPGDTAHPGAHGGPAHVPPSPAGVPGRAHFAVLEGTVREIDWLELHPAGHRRARWGRGPGRWLQP